MVVIRVSLSVLIGSISAEHGIGQLKKKGLYSSRSREELAVMEQIKNVLDPNGILNPGKIFHSS
jgi:FAD/FMN-containing dehydrogenase